MVAKHCGSGFFAMQVFKDRGLPRVITKMGMRQLARKAGQVASVAGLMVVLAAASAMASTTTENSGITTHTELVTANQEVSGRTVATYTATVLGEDGAPATGSVSLVEGSRHLASAALDATGKANIRYDALPSGYHALTAVYNGDAIHLASQSSIVTIHPEAAASPDFSLGINVVGSTDGTTMTLAAPGDSGSLVATVTPSKGFTGFISLSLTGPAAVTGTAGGTSLPTGVTYSFAPANLQLIAPTTANPTAAQTADMQVITAAYNGLGSNGDGPNLRHGVQSTGGQVFLAILLPGAVVLGYIGRKRKQFLSVLVLVLLGGLTTVTLTGCAARYKYLNHGPAPDGTQPGTYTLTVTAQTSDGVTSSSQSQTMTLVVK
jgi:hypothetical protein